MPTTKSTITPAARHLARQHNSEYVSSGHIYLVELRTGSIVDWVASYAATQIAPGHKLYGKFALLRISHGKLSQASAQAFLDAKGEGW